ncbi:MAG TPA: bifunctional demethylmenaquinone methyltransferase/2-methoxy-6-polyprenyl-1,4-benzoquinol methylase UbiE [Cyclobacteriaceae bacterium]|nr:bifunctional demethylmenaquinone methyltransferase/2-methoxy-6-polyprenyl-1,4-benzoquinol methylase UbiE [Cyclobacteriaceae bacterium]
MTVVPYKEAKESKKTQVATMFNNISHRYDFLNHFLSLGIDVRWRKKAIRMLQDLQPKIMLDVATGTGDFAIAALKLNPEQVIGIDISEGMLDMGRKKLIKRKLDNRITLMSGDSENMPFEENKFDAIIVAFGVRNFENLEKGLVEMHRVLRPGGRVVILEFSKPLTFPFKQIYNFYFKFILPKIGRLVSSDKSAYTYLPESVDAFPEGKKFTTILETSGYKNATCKPLTFGISSIYTAEK